LPSLQAPTRHAVPAPAPLATLLRAHGHDGEGRLHAGTYPDRFWAQWPNPVFPSSSSPSHLLSHTHTGAQTHARTRSLSEDKVSHQSRTPALLPARAYVCFVARPGQEALALETQLLPQRKVGVARLAFTRQEGAPEVVLVTLGYLLVDDRLPDSFDSVLDVEAVAVCLGLFSAPHTCYWSGHALACARWHPVQASAHRLG
jgi:hypothetical protein